MSLSTSPPPSRLARSRIVALLLGAVALIVVTVLLVADRSAGDPVGPAPAAAPGAPDAMDDAMDEAAEDTASAPDDAPTTVAAGSSTPVSMGEFSFEMPSEFEAGRHTFEVVNDGDVPHEFALGQVGSHGAHFGQTEWLDAGVTEVLEVDLAPGTYEVACHVPGHYESGMTTTVTVVG